MDIEHDMDRRLTDLEVKMSFTEDLVDTLNQIVIRQQQQIDRLLREVQQMREQQDLQSQGAGALRNVRDELPPHY